MHVIEQEFISYRDTVPAVLDALGAADVLRRQACVLLKPNLVMASAPPVTTPVACIEALIDYVRGCSLARIIVAEGCGAADYDTAHCFDVLGYTAMADRLDVQLLDLNTAPTVALNNAKGRVFPVFHLPRIATEAYIVSVPVLKAHSLSEITGTLKNMMGFAPPRHYQKGGHWKKSAFHARLHEAIVELNRYCTPDLTLLDATVGLRDYHLGGATCVPPIGKLLASFDPVAIDRRAAALLGRDWRTIAHLR